MARPFFHLRDFGAIGDGQALDTPALTAALAACHRGGGGTVVADPGCYRIGTVELLSHVTLHLSAGAVLKGSGDLADYPPLPFRSEGRNTALLFAAGATNVALTGDGTIDGNGAAFAIPDQADTYRDFDATCTRQGEAYCRINDLPDDGPVRHRARPGILILLLNCRGLRVTNLTLRDAPNWCLHVACSEDIHLAGLTIASSLILPNSDGIDVSLSRNVRISDCHIVAGDDAIAFSPCADGFGAGICENVAVTNCVLSARSSAIRIGWGEHPFRNLVFQNIVIRDSLRGIGLFVRDHGSIENVLFSNIVIQTRLYTGKWWGKAEPIHLSIVPTGFARGPLGKIRAIKFSHLVIEGEQGIVLHGLPGNPIEGVTFHDVALRLVAGPLQGNYGGNFDFRPAADTAQQVFTHDVPALHAHGVRQLAIDDFHVETNAGLPDFFRHGLEIEDFDDVSIDGLRDGVVRAGGDRDCSIMLRRGIHASVTRCRSAGQKTLSLHAESVEDLVQGET